MRAGPPCLLDATASLSFERKHTIHDIGCDLLHVRNHVRIGDCSAQGRVERLTSKECLERGEERLTLLA
jgi:hypothetical protein